LFATAFRPGTREKEMNPAQKVAVLVFITLLTATIYGLIRTETEINTLSNGTSPATSPEDAGLVDQTPLKTAEALAATPTTPAELPFARQALQLADKEMDQAFAMAVLDATQHPPAVSTEAKEIQVRRQRAEDALSAQQARVARLTAAEAKAIGADKDTLDDQLNLAKAQLELRQDEVDDAKEDLIRAGGDPQGRLEAMVQEHEAASHVADTTRVSASAPVEPRGLIQRFQQWWALYEKQLQLRHARQDAISTAAALTKEHESLDTKIGAQTDKSADSIAPEDEPGPIDDARRGGRRHEESVAKLKTTRRDAADRKTLATLDRRISNERQLAGAYEQWIGIVAKEQLTLVHGGLRTLLLILAIAIVGFFADYWTGRMFGKMSMDRRRGETLRTVTHVTIQVIGVLFLLLVIFGAPTALGTFLGLAGAGLTVALKDFIISFLGWFVLLGKSGIRVGDWVEINGVTGEVVELGMFHTVLLETGNWTDQGHPTGRRVTFTNNYAVEGHYFNFSTSGQWLWDEFQIVLPAGRDPYRIVEAIQKNVLEATSEGARQAEEEWKRASKSNNLKSISVAPAINVKPIIGGIEVSIRYITRASERSQLRAKLNHAVVDLLGAGSTS